MSLEKRCSAPWCGDLSVSPGAILKGQGVCSLAAVITMLGRVVIIMARHWRASLGSFSGRYGGRGPPVVSPSLGASFPGPMLFVFCFNARPRLTRTGLSSAPLCCRPRHRPAHCPSRGQSSLPSQIGGPGVTGRASGQRQSTRHLKRSCYVTVVRASSGLNHLKIRNSGRAATAPDSHGGEISPDER